MRILFRIKIIKILLYIKDRNLKQMSLTYIYISKQKRGFLTASVVSDFVQQYSPLKIKPNPDCHDRLIVLDYGEETELVYHCGASSKDAGKKLCAINQITETAIIHPVIDRLLSLPDKQI